MSSSLGEIAPAPDPLVGRTLAERYRVVRRLGEGGMGAVYEAEHLLIKKRVAIKVLHATYATSAEIVARFHQEALAATAIGHEHIVEVNDMGRTPDGALFMVLELLQGRDFADLLESETALPIGRVVHIVMQICDALQAAHDKGIVHRDLKPENVFLVKRGGDPDFVKVLDFGISKMQQSEGEGGPRAATRTGAIMGTALYISPEQAMGKRSVDHRTDIWALGVILYRAITTRYPFLHEAFPALILQICSEAPVRPSQLRSDIAPELESVILRCLDKDPAARPQSCAELIAALAPFRHVSALMPSTRFSVPSPSHETPRATSSVRPKQTGTAAFVATLASTSGEPGGAPPATAAEPAAPTELERSLARAPRAPWLVATAVLVVVGGLAGAYALRAPTDGAVPVADASRLPEAPVVPAVDAPPAPTASRAIEFVVSPAEAVVLIDGRPLVPDAEGALRRPVADDDLALHELRVEARGFRGRVEDLRLSHPQRIVVALDPGAGVEDRRVAAVPAPVTSQAPRSRGARAERAQTERRAQDEPPTVRADAPVSAPPAQPAPTVAARDPEPEPEPSDPAPGVVVPPPRRALKRVTVP